MRTVVIVVILPLAKLLVEEMNIGGDAVLVQELIELLVVDAKRVKQEPLPPIREGHYATIRIERQQPPAQPATDHPAVPLEPEIVFERDPANAIVVEPEARLTRPLVRRCRSRTAEPPTRPGLHSSRSIKLPRHPTL